MSSKMASVLFTDMVGSTELWQRLGDEEAGRLRAWHDDLVGEVVVAAGGRVVKGLGDGLMAVFYSASDAVSAATTVHQHLHRDGRRDPEGRVKVRIGISAGDVELTEGDCFGTAVIEASRLCDSAQAGQTLVADLVRALSRGRGGHIFDSVGSLELKGLDAPVAASRVAWSPLESDQASLRFPELLRPTSAVAYVGRPALLERVHSEWKGAAAGRARLLLLAGEPGVGKTRTAAELAQRAHGDGAVVLYGRCDEEVRVPYQPFAEGLDWYTLNAPSRALGRYAGDLRRLIPDLGQRVVDLPPAVSSDPQTEEHRLLLAVASWLIEASREKGLLLVLDDLHWAGSATLRMLVEVFRQAGADDEARLLLVGTYRDTDIDRTTPLTSVLADLRRLPGVVRCSVDGFEPDEVVAFVERAAGHGLDDAMLALTRTVHAETEGNPFFVSETLRHLVETGQARFVDGRWSVAGTDVWAVPEGVRDVVGRRLDILSPAAVEILTAGAVLGRSFRWAVVSKMVDLGLDEVADVLDDALRARIVEEQSSDELRFVHALVRSSLLEELSSIRRRRLHQRAVAAITAAAPYDLEALAHHSVAAVPSGDKLVAAVEHCLRAGSAARERRASADAVHHLGRARELLAELDVPDPSLEARVLGELGQAQRDEGGHDHRSTLREAARLALAADDLELATEVLTVQGRGFIPTVNGEVDTELVQLMRDALARVPPDETAWRARLLAALSLEQFYDIGVAAEENVKIAERALELAEADGDPRLQAEVLLRSNMAWAIPTHWSLLPATADRLRRLAGDVGDPALAAGAAYVALRATMYLNDFAEAERVCVEAIEIAQEANPELEAIFRFIYSTFPSLRGDFAEAERRLTAAEEIAARVGSPDAPIYSIGTRYLFALIRNEFDPEFVKVFLAFTDVMDTGIGHVGAAALHALHVSPEAGFERLERHGLHHARAVRDDLMKPYGLAFLSIAAHHSGHETLAASVARELAPFRDRMATVIQLTAGPVIMYLTLAVAASGQLDEAVDQLGETIAVVRRDGPAFEPFFARWAIDMLLRRGRPDDLSRAERVVTEALEAADRFAMPAWRPELKSVLATGESASLHIS